MTRVESNIRTALESLSPTPMTLETAKVVSVDEDKAVMDVDLQDGRKRYGVALRAASGSGDGVTMVPAVDSIVLIGKLAMSNQYVMINHTTLSKIFWKVGNMKMELTEDGFVFNDGGLNGMVKIDDLVSKLNALENKMSSHQHAYVGQSGPAVTTPDGSQTIAQTNRSEIENTKIKQ